MPLNHDLVNRIINGLWLIFLAYWAINAFDNKKSVFQQNARSRMIYLFSFIIFAYIIFSIPQLGKSLFETTFAIQLGGIAACAAGIAFAIWARRILGANWSGIVTVKENHELIRRGPYRFVRHPIYTGIILAMAGTVVANVPNWHGLLCFIFLTVGLRMKSLYEEKLMCQQFPEQYPTYQREVKALVPFVY